MDQGQPTIFSNHESIAMTSLSCCATIATSVDVANGFTWVNVSIASVSAAVAVQPLMVVFPANTVFLSQQTWGVFSALSASNASSADSPVVVDATGSGEGSGSRAKPAVEAPSGAASGLATTDSACQASLGSTAVFSCIGGLQSVAFQVGESVCPVAAACPNFDGPFGPQSATAVTTLTVSAAIMQSQTNLPAMASTAGATPSPTISVPASIPMGGESGNTPVATVASITAVVTLIVCMTFFLVLYKKHSFFDRMKRSFGFQEAADNQTAVSVDGDTLLLPPFDRKNSDTFMMAGNPDSPVPPARHPGYHSLPRDWVSSNAHPPGQEISGLLLSNCSVAEEYEVKDMATPLECRAMSASVAMEFRPLISLECPTKSSHPYYSKIHEGSQSSSSSSGHKAAKDPFGFIARSLDRKSHSYGGPNRREKGLSIKSVAASGASNQTNSAATPIEDTIATQPRHKGCLTGKPLLDFSTHPNSLALTPPTTTVALSQVTPQLADLPLKRLPAVLNQTAYGVKSSLTSPASETIQGSATPPAATATTILVPQPPFPFPPLPLLFFPPMLPSGATPAFPLPPPPPFAAVSTGLATEADRTVPQTSNEAIEFALLQRRMKKLADRERRRMMLQGFPADMSSTEGSEYDDETNSSAVSEIVDGGESGEDEEEEEALLFLQMQLRMQHDAAFESSGIGRGVLAGEEGPGVAMEGRVLTDGDDLPLAQMALRNLQAQMAVRNIQQGVV
ncbi:hypothetical protein BC830DRAFT_1147718 [Chytriomyces sp. MP71]|nr:hypothetical protein BC830DRAFT_1147718 [Chytriomyces sp. MP71]